MSFIVTLMVVPGLKLKKVTKKVTEKKLVVTTDDIPTFERGYKTLLGVPITTECQLYLKYEGVEHLQPTSSKTVLDAAIFCKDPNVTLGGMIWKEELEQPAEDEDVVLRFFVDVAGKGALGKRHHPISNHLT